MSELPLESLQHGSEGEPEPSPPRPPNWPLLILSASVGLCLIIAALVGAYYFVVVQPLKTAKNLAAEVGKAWSRILPSAPRITVNHQVVVAESKAIQELATVTKDFHVEREQVETWFGSTQKIKARGKYRAKAGFDLNESYRVEVSSAPLSVLVLVPEPYILSVERTSYLHLDEEAGLWNKISPEQREQFLNELDLEAKRQVKQSRILDDAKQGLEFALRQVADRYDAKLQIIYSGRAAPSTPIPLLRE